MQSAGQGKSRKIILDGRYELESKLAVRANGTIYRARRIMLGDHVAVRILRPELVKDRSAYERFCRQAQIAARTGLSQVHVSRTLRGALARLAVQLRPASTEGQTPAIAVEARTS